MLAHDDVGTNTLADPSLKDQRDYVNQSGLSRQAIFNQVNASLDRLQTSYIDLLQIHRSDLKNVPAEVRQSYMRSDLTLMYDGYRRR
jgi:aryl-alcohol dehydrogenase-like predicted oxidoreductase